MNPHKTLSMLLTSSVAAIVMNVNACKGQEMKKEPEHFNFDYFEKMPSNEIAIERAKSYLVNKYPKGSLIFPALQEIREAGATCERGIDRNIHFERCHFQRPGHGLMALVSTIEWVIVFDTTERYDVIENIIVNRGATGP